MKLKKRHWILIIGVIALIAYNYAPVTESLKIKAEAEPICINGYCEPQVVPDCKNSRIKIQPCQKISENLWRWINSHGASAIETAYYESGHTDPVKSATIYCNSGIYNQKRISGRKRWSQHSYRRACDGNRIRVNGKMFTYKGKGVRRPKTTHDRFFISFLDNWGTVGLGLNVRSAFYFLDFNRGVRDCREDNRHCYHYHLSKPCYTCIFTRTMGYE